MGLLQYDINRRYGVEECMVALSQQRSMIPQPVNRPASTTFEINILADKSHQIPIYVNGRRKISNSKPNVPQIKKGEYMYSH